jgi:hypothetical protein
MDVGEEIVLKHVDNQLIEQNDQITIEINQNNDVNSIDLDN